MKILDLAVRLTVASVPVVIVGVLGSLLWLGISAIERSKVLEVASTEWRRIAHVQAIVAAMVQLDEVEAYADEQNEAIMHDRAQLALLAATRT